MVIINNIKKGVEIPDIQCVISEGNLVIPAIDKQHYADFLSRCTIVFLYGNKSGSGEYTLRTNAYYGDEVNFGPITPSEWHSLSVYFPGLIDDVLDAPEIQNVGGELPPAEYEEYILTKPTAGDPQEV